MLRWRGRRAESPPPDAVAPEALDPPLDPECFRRKFAGLQEALSGIGGADSLLAALGRKAERFRTALGREAIAGLDAPAIERMRVAVMPARRRLAPVADARAVERWRASAMDLLYGKGPLWPRLEAFADTAAGGGEAEPRAARKRRRGALDLGAEMLHFADPERYPLMTRWVWDRETASGAMRDLLAQGETLREIPWGPGPGVYEAGRVWIAQQMTDRGVYRGAHFLVDLFLAHVYADYMRGMSAGMGMLKADFGGADDPLELVRKLLGIDGRGDPGDDAAIARDGHGDP